MPELPLAYHITVGTYGTRLHGDERGTVDRSHNRPGDPIIGLNEDWLRVERNRLKFDPIYLTDKQRTLIETQVPDICDRGGWVYHIAAAKPDHMHVLLSSPNDGEVIRKLLKR